MTDRVSHEPNDLPRFRPGGNGWMNLDDNGGWVPAQNVLDILLTLKPHILDREKIAMTLSMIERLR